MRTYITRIINIALIITTLAGYNAVTSARADADAEARKAAGIQTAAAGSYEDGVYEGEAQGYGGTVRMQVKIEDGSITEINELSAENEDEAYWVMAEDIIPQMIEKQTNEVDTISGATYSSTGIKDAVGEALKEATK